MSGARWVWLGQDPGKNEVLQGRPFVGNTGRRLLDMWNAACKNLGVKPIERREVWITNACCCMPVTNGDKEAREAVLCCRPRLMRELAQVNDNAGILVLGKWALLALTGMWKGGGKLHGFHVKLKKPTGFDDPSDLREPSE